MSSAPHPFDFFGSLVWLDGRPLLDTVEPYRKAIFEEVLFTFDDTGRPRYSLALCGRAKKNWKTADLILAGLYRLLAWPSPEGNDCFLIANDEGQAGDDLQLAKKIVNCNSVLAREVAIKQKSIERVDGQGSMQILPAGDVVGQHGKTFLFIGYDEIHGYRSHDLFEALAPDPTRRDALQWITSYAGIRHAPGIPLFDLMTAGKRGDDPRMYFSWYGGDFTTDPNLAAEDVSPEVRANPSMANWGSDDYLETQRRRLPRHKYRRLHLNLPGAPDGAAFAADSVMGAVVTGRKRLAPQKGIDYYAFVDMSGGSSDEAVLAISHGENDGARAVLDLLVSQTGTPPFNPRVAVKKFAAVLREYRVFRVVGDSYAGLTFQLDFQEDGIVYETSDLKKSEIYDALEPRLNAGEVELLDIPKMQEQLLSLVVRGAGKIDHLPGDHDDHANAAAGAISMITGSAALFNMWNRLGAVTQPSAPVAGPGQVLVEVKDAAVKPPALGRWLRPGWQVMTVEDAALVAPEVKPELGKVMLDLPRKMNLTLAHRIMRGGKVVSLPGRTIELPAGRQNVDPEIGNHYYVKPFIVKAA